MLTTRHHLSPFARHDPPSQRSGGFSLPEMLIAMMIASVLLVAAARMLPALQRNLLRQAQADQLQEDLWHVAFAIGKHLQRAGYCKGDCAGQGLLWQETSHCLIVQWDANHNGQWESSPSANAEQTGYRLRKTSLETQRGVSDCQSQPWEKITDPRQLRIRQFQLDVQPRSNLPPLLHIRLSAQISATGQMIQIEHSVVGYNL